MDLKKVNKSHSFVSFCQDASHVRESFEIWALIWSKTWRKEDTYLLRKTSKGDYNKLTYKWVFPAN